MFSEHLNLRTIRPAAQVKTCLRRQRLSPCTSVTVSRSNTLRSQRSSDVSWPRIEMFYDTSHSYKTWLQRSRVWSGARLSRAGPSEFLFSSAGISRNCTAPGQVDMGYGRVVQILWWSRCPWWLILHNVGCELLWCRIGFSTAILGRFFRIARRSPRRTRTTWN